jgi:hypothetical protein
LILLSTEVVPFDTSISDHQDQLAGPVGEVLSSHLFGVREGLSALMEAI